MGKYIHLSIAKRVEETADAVSLYFKKPIIKKLRYQSGQFLTFVFKVNGEEEFRSYSLNSAPGIDKYYSITVKRVKGGLLSNYIIDHVKEGQKMVVKKPRGTFKISPKRIVKRQVVLFGAGSGITPLFSMAKTILFKEKKSQVTLVYGNTNEDTIIFKKELEILEEKFPQRFKVVHYLSRPAPQWKGHIGRLESATIPHVLSEIKPSDPIKSEYYICGPDGMMASVEEGLNRMGVVEQDIFKESFTKSEKTITPEAQALNYEPRTLKIKVGREEHGLHVPANTTILYAALQNKLKVPNSCSSGICATCLCKVKKGEVEMIGEHCLSEKEVQKGYVLACMSYAKSEEILLEVV